jgi:hypothetical protein
MPVVPEFERLGQEDHFKASLGNKVRPHYKKKKKKKRNQEKRYRVCGSRAEGFIMDSEGAVREDFL